MDYAFRAGMAEHNGCVCRWLVIDQVDTLLCLAEV